MIFSLLLGYIELQHTPEEFARIMTLLDSMQDGPIKDFNGDKLIDLEVRQNRPDLLSIIGIAIEYAAYTKQNIKMPKMWQEGDVKRSSPNKIFKVETDNLLRFSAIKINDVFVSESPDWLKNALVTYGINPINNIVDITNYVMLEFGIPMHAFDLNKITPLNEGPLFTIKMANGGEKFTTWQGTDLTLKNTDLILEDKNKVLSIGGISGDPSSGVTNDTINIILEAANYNQAIVRKSSIIHNLRTESSLRHEKFLSSVLVGQAMRRATYLIQEICGGTVELFEDYYPSRELEANRTLSLNINEVERLSGVELNVDLIKELLSRLKFQIIDHKEIVEIANNNILVKIPDHRTDIYLEEHLVGEILRLWGYQNIPFREINNAPPKDITPKSFTLKRKLKDIATSLGYDEQITAPFTEITTDKSIKLENSINKVQDKLRTDLNEGLDNSIETHKKYSVKVAKVFEINTVYHYIDEDYVEKETASFKVLGIDFKNVKSDLHNVLSKLGYDLNYIDIKYKDSVAVYYYNSSVIANLFDNGFDLNFEVITEQINLNNIPALVIQIKPIQKIVETITVSKPNNIKSNDIVEKIKTASKQITDIIYSDEYKDKNNNVYVTYQIEISDTQNQLTRERINAIITLAVQNLNSIDCILKK